MTGPENLPSNRFPGDTETAGPGPLSEGCVMPEVTNSMSYSNMLISCTHIHFTNLKLCPVCFFYLLVVGHLVKIHSLY